MLSYLCNENKQMSLYNYRITTYNDANIQPYNHFITTL